tara:strand:+ start:2536 stop:3462 length:927 start_codon:yes stop_codon:yes gene_type:complete
MEPTDLPPESNHPSKEQSTFNTSDVDALRVSVLSEALPYIQRFAGKRIVIKYGGAAMVDKHLKKAVLRDIALLSSVGVQPVVVHGGGPEINFWLNRLDIKTEFLDGLRVTDSQTMDIVEMVLVGRVNKQIVTGINQLGALSIGLCGIDGNLIESRPFNKGRYGLVGEISKVNAEVLEPLLSKGYIPVISSVASSEEGGSLNINADTVAGELAAALGAEKLILLTDTPGILRNKNDPSSLISKIRLSEIRQLTKDGVVEGGMMPKTECCIRALAQGVSAAHIINGKIPHAILLEVFTNIGIGTMVVSSG